MTDGTLRLQDVRGDDAGWALRPAFIGSPSQSSTEMTPRSLSPEINWLGARRAALRRDAPRDHAHRRALGEIEKLLQEGFDLALGDLGPALVDLGLLTGGRIDDGEVRAGLALDPREVVQDRLGRQELEGRGCRWRRRRDQWR